MAKEAIEMTIGGMELKISSIARATGFDPSTIRYYERIGLIPQPQRTDSGHRIYEIEDVERLKMISNAKTLGLCLEDIAAFLARWEQGECPSARAMLEQLVAAKLSDLERRITDLTTFHNALLGAHEALINQPSPAHCGAGCGCDVVTSVRIDDGAFAMGRRSPSVGEGRDSPEGAA